MRWSRPRSTRSSALSIAIAIVLLFAFGFYLRHVPDPFLDFRAFYCAGQAERTGVDPYREHPLHECERSLAAPGLPSMRTDATIPAPFPGFVLAIFAVVSLLPFPLALLLWASAAGTALASSIVIVAKTNRVSVAASAIILGFPGAVVALPLGQVTPFILLALAGCASLLKRGRPRLAALAALGALLDPHVGLALCLGLFVNVRQTRAVLLAAAVGLLVVGGIASGPAYEWEYLHAVLPAHALANVSDAAQFSITNFAFDAGASPRLALLAGGVWYVAALALGVFVACRLRTRLGVAAVAYVPTAFAVFGGTYTHLQQLALALPAFLLLGSVATGRLRDWCNVLTFVAAVPWLLIAPYPWFFIVPSTLAFFFAREMRSARDGIRLAAGSFIILTSILIAIVHLHIARTPAHAIVSGNPLADASWQMFTIARNVPVESWSLLAKCPTVAAFLVLLSALVALASRSMRVIVNQSLATVP